MTTVVHSDTYEAITFFRYDLTGKAVFMSGASKGIRCAIAIGYAEAGASIIATAARSDLYNAEEKMRDAIYIAGIVARGQIEVNVFGPYHVMTNFMPLFLEGGDKSIVVVNSVEAHLTTATVRMPKLAVLRLAEFACQEYGTDGPPAYSGNPRNIPTDIVGGLEGLTSELRQVLVDKAQLCAQTLVSLTSKKRDCFAGRYVNVTWDMSQLMAQKEDIVQAIS
ncbi:hypothetical protein GGR57DRAFT_493246 [Xylariaceae sp. FL1272]|nr:hypothetical protein GGR57DRAFT_493246 [Xylariaceae sp. FL1272]